VEAGFCEKDCTQCGMREELNCPGCRMGPGNEMYGDCGIAGCCRKHKWENCGACPKRIGCTELAVKELLPARRKTRHELRSSRAEVMGTRAPFLRKCFWALFWMTLLPGFLPSLIETEGRQYYALRCVDQVMVLLAAIIVIAMAKEERGYQLPGCLLAGLAVHDFLMNLFTVTEPPLWSVLTSLVTPYVKIAAIWLLFEAHAETASDLGGGLTMKWKRLRKWSAGSILTAELCNYLMIFGPILFTVIAGIAVLVMVVAEIVELVYLARMAKGYKRLGS